MTDEGEGAHAHQPNRIDAAEAHRIGLIDHCVPDNDLHATITALSTEIATNSAGTNRIVKRLIADGDHLGRHEALQRKRTLPHRSPTTAVIDSTPRVDGRSVAKMLVGLPTLRLRS